MIDTFGTISISGRLSATSRTILSKQDYALDLRIGYSAAPGFDHQPKHRERGYPRSNKRVARKSGVTRIGKELFALRAHLRRGAFALPVIEPFARIKRIIHWTGRLKRNNGCRDLNGHPASHIRSRNLRHHRNRNLLLAAGSAGRRSTRLATASGSSWSV